MIDVTSFIATFLVVISLSTIILRKKLVDVFFFGLIGVNFVVYLMFYNQASDITKPFWSIVGFTLIYYIYLITQSTLQKSKLKNNKKIIFTPSNDYSFIVGNTGTGGISGNYQMGSFILNLAMKGEAVQVHYVNFKFKGEQLWRFLQFVDPFDNLKVYKSIDEFEHFYKEFTNEIKNREIQFNEGNSLKGLPTIYLICDEDDPYVSNLTSGLIDKYKESMRKLRIVFVLSKRAMDHLEFFTESSVLRSRN